MIKLLRNQLIVFTVAFIIYKDVFLLEGGTMSALDALEVYDPESPTDEHSPQPTIKV